MMQEKPHRLKIQYTTDLVYAKKIFKRVFVEKKNVSYIKKV